MILTLLFGILSCIALGLMLWQLAEALRFPLDRRLGKISSSPGVTILKPLKGCDTETAACLKSWVEQDYPGPMQILFGVAASDDPVCEVVRKLMAAHPKADAQLLVCGESLGPNAKVSTLVQLAPAAKHPVLIVSDADVRVPPDLVGQVAAPLVEPGVGLVNCFYRLANPSTFPMRLEAFAVNGDFWGQVLQAQRLKPMNFALGAVMAFTQERLAKAGGFRALLDYLADDYQLGHRIAQSGGRVVLSPVVVECWNAPQNWREVWAHQLRWARTTRVCRPVSYFFSVLGDYSIWPILWMLVGTGNIPLLGGGVCLLLRMTTGLILEKKFNPRGGAKGFWLAPIKDLLWLLVWVLAFLGNTVRWRGQRFRVLAGGKLVKI